MLVPADLYVRLRAPADVLVDRLVDREQDEALRATQHDWLVDYERMLDAALQGRPVVEVDTDCSLDEAMERACTAVENAPQLAGLRGR